MSLTKVTSSLVRQLFEQSLLSAYPKIDDVTVAKLSDPFDFWWHNQFGFDGLLSPPHSILAVGMLLASLGAIIGIFQIDKHENKKSNNVISCTSIKVNSAMTIAFSVLWIVSIGLIFMFTLPFSKGQYFDFNPDPLTALVANAALIPFITGLIFFAAGKIILTTKSEEKVKKDTSPSVTTKSWYRYPFTFTAITGSVMFLQIITTITSNPYFINDLYLYLLNILPALVCDFLLLKYIRNIGSNERCITKKRSKNNLLSKMSQIITERDHKQISLIVSVIMSIFYITIFYPWSFDLYKHYFFGPDENVVMKNISVFQYLFLTKILPIIIPFAIVMGFMDGITMNKIMKWKIDENNEIPI